MLNPDVRRILDMRKARNLRRDPRMALSIVPASHRIRSAGC